jgi:superfamily II DNA or RNA helicase
VTQRFFNRQQRLALRIASEGRCAQCGEQLQPGWHADHVEPFSAGGKTDVLNGQALCAQCNLSKGAKVKDSKFGEWDSKHKMLRGWQAAADEAYRTKAASKRTDAYRNTFVCVAWPGSGKTLFGTHVAHTGLLDRGIELVVVVAPTVSVRGGWVEEFLESGRMNLNGTWEPKAAIDYPLGVGPQYVGIATTYASVLQNVDVFRKLTQKYRTMVILDEFHHAAVDGLKDNSGWGDALLSAFSGAAERLLLSGTPWREDERAMPFICYDKSVQESQWDFYYGYAEALADGNCRPVEFLSYDGDTEWLTKGQKISSSFAELLDEEKLRQRLNTALTLRKVGKVFQPSWLTEVLTDAHKNLLKIRATESPMEVRKARGKREAIHAKAGGLILAIDVKHAQLIAEFMRSLGVNPIVVTHEDATSHEAINRFKYTDDEWIISVKMVSEGVDIKRLRVLVYATNVLTETFFIQALGRVLRKLWRRKTLEMAYVYMPREERLMGFGRDVIKQRNAGYEMAKQRDDDEKKTPPGPGPGPGSGSSSFFPLGSDGVKSDVIALAGSYSSERLQRSEYDEALELIERLGLDVPTADAALIIRAARGGPIPPPVAADEDETEPRVLDDVLAEKRSQCADLIRKLAYRWSQTKDMDIGKACKQVAMALKDRDGCWQDDRRLTTDMLDVRMKWLNAQLTAATPPTEAALVWRKKATERDPNNRFDIEE